MTELQAEELCESLTWMWFSSQSWNGSGSLLVIRWMQCSGYTKYMTFSKENLYHDEFEFPCEGDFKCLSEVSGWKEICLGKWIAEKSCIFFTCESLLVSLPPCTKAVNVINSSGPAIPCLARGASPLHHRAKQLMLKSSSLLVRCPPAATHCSP